MRATIWALAAIILSCAGALADEDMLAGEVLAAHYEPAITYSYDPPEGG